MLLELKLPGYGSNCDDLADGSGKAGLTFQTVSMDIQSRMNATKANVGGWKASELRAKMDSGEIWNLMPSDFQSKVKTVKKLTNNVSGADEDAAVTAALDRLFLLSYSEIVETPYSGWSGYSWIGTEGTQYEAFKGKVTQNYSGNACLQIGDSWWERSVNPNNSTTFLCVLSNGEPSNNNIAMHSFCVCPAFSF